MELTTYTPDMLPAVVAFWNSSFHEKRNFFPVTEDVLRARIFDKKTCVERFDPEQFLIAVEGDRIAGVLHCLVRGEEMCRALDAKWPGGEQGCIAFFHVAEAFRGRGIGSRLFETALQALKDTARVIIDTRCNNPFYGNSTGPRTPLWGHTEGIGIEGDDVRTTDLLDSLGFTTTDTARSLLLDFSKEETKRTRPLLPPSLGSLHVLENAQPALGTEIGMNVPYDDDCEYTSIACVKDGVAVGVITFYEMEESDRGKGAIYLLEVEEEHRRQGIGRALVVAAIDAMRERGWKSCETLTIPALSPGAIAIYEALGFEHVARWALY